MILEFSDYKIAVYKKLKINTRFNYLLIHGFAADHREMMNLAPKLRDGNVYAIDLIGHGNSVLLNQKRKLDYKIFVESINQVISALKLKNVIIIGHSIGSLFAVMISATNPVVVKTVLLSPPPIDISEDLNLVKRLVSTDSNVLRKLVREELLYKPNKIITTIIAHVIARKNKKLHDMYNRIFQDLSSSMNQATFNKFVAKLNTPTLIVSGLDDPISKPVEISLLSNQIPIKHELVMMPLARHSLCIRRAKDVAKIINNWN